jgi:hypothetical protein
MEIIKIAMNRKCEFRLLLLAVCPDKYPLAKTRVKNDIIDIISVKNADKTSIENNAAPTGLLKFTTKKSGTPVIRTRHDKNEIIAAPTPVKIIMTSDLFPSLKKNCVNPPAAKIIIPIKKRVTFGVPSSLPQFDQHIQEHL